MNAKNRERAIEERRNVGPPNRRTKPMPEHLGGEPMTSSKAKAEAARRRTKRRMEQREAAKQRRQVEGRRKAKARRMAKVGSHYWITPKATRRHCSHCPSPTAIAIRPSDQKAACAACIDRLGIKARRSATTTSVSEATVRHVEPGAPFIRPGHEETELELLGWEQWETRTGPWSDDEEAERVSASADDLRDRAAAGEVEGWAA